MTAARRSTYINLERQAIICHQVRKTTPLVHEEKKDQFPSPLSPVTFFLPDPATILLRLDTLPHLYRRLVTFASSEVIHSLTVPSAWSNSFSDDYPPLQARICSNLLELDDPNHQALNYIFNRWEHDDGSFTRERSSFLGHSACVMEDFRPR